MGREGSVRERKEGMGRENSLNTRLERTSHSQTFNVKDKIKILRRV